METRNNIKLSKSQIEFFRSEKDYTLFAGGLGSGKTYAGAVWAISMVLRYPKFRGLITANSYKQLSKATLIKVFEICDEMGLRYKYRQQKGELEIEGVTVDCVSMENYDDLRGPEYGWAWSDECAFYKAEAFDVLQGRIRAAGAPCQWKGTTTPNGFNWLYTKFKEDPIPKSIVIRSRTADNIANLSSSYYDNLRRSYDSVLSRQELDGEFVNLNSGKVYYAFDRFKHCKQNLAAEQIIYVGLDFNVHPLCGIFCHIRDGVIFVFDELYLENSNTFQAAKEVKTRYPFHRIQMITDDSGAKRTTKSKYTDHEIIRRALGSDALIKFRNPGVKDRYNNVNRLFEYGKLVISPNCKKLIADLEKLVHDNKDDMLSHISDALGYACWQLAPLKKPRRKAEVKYIKG